MSSKSYGMSISLGLIGAAVGGVLGFFAFQFLHSQNLYALGLPGALLGLGAGLLVGRKSYLLGTICGLASLGLGIFVEWKFFPFSADESFSYFVQHLHQLKPITLILIVLGGVFGFWFGKGRESSSHSHLDK